MARPNENDNSHGNLDLYRAFIAFNRAEANSEVCPPDKKAIPGTAAGTTRNKHFTVASATSSTVFCCKQSKPGTIIFGFKIIPSSSTPCVYSCSKTTCNTCSVTRKQRSNE